MPYHVRPLVNFYMTGLYPNRRMATKFIRYQTKVCVAMVQVSQSPLKPNPEL